MNKEINTAEGRRVSEISRELEHLEKSIASMKEAIVTLRERIDSVLVNRPTATSKDEKDVESETSLANQIARARREVSGCVGGIREMIELCEL